jgi:hypothetical protein
MVELGEESQLAHVSRPTAIVRLDEQELNFRRAVAAAMKLPFTMTEGSAASGGGGPKEESTFFNGARSIESVEEKQLAATVLRERAFYSVFFEHIYASVFGTLDMQEMERAQEQYETLLHDMKRARNLGRELARELAGTDAPPADTKARHDEALALAGTKDARRKVRTSITRVRAILLRMQASGRGGASLVFQPGMTRDAINQLTGLLAIFDRGLLAAKTLQPFVQAVFGAGLTLREPPLPAAGTSAGKKRPLPGGGGGGPKKKKARTSTAESEGKTKKRSSTDETEAARRARTRRHTTEKAQKSNKPEPDPEEKKKKKKKSNENDKDSDKE